MRITFVLLSVLFTFCCQAQDKVPAVKKISASLQNVLKTKKEHDSIDIVISVNNAATISSVSTKFRVLATHPESNTFVCRIKKDTALNFINNTNINFADALRQPKEELTTGSQDITLNKLNLAHHLFPSITGEDIKISIKEQSFDPADIDWKGRYFNSGVAALAQTTHAAIMATMAGGAGNTSPAATGAAPGAYLTSSSFANLLPDADAVYQQYNITVQNHSYGTGIENYYGGDAAAYDWSTYNNPSLLHIFSSGNSGMSAGTGAYAGLPQIANITGSFKMSKNSIAVGAVDSFNQVMALSSKGPAYDGRVKPEIVAFGEDGSSGAAAIVSGTAALVQQAYKQATGKLPTAALTKAILLNSADDAGKKGIDYEAGYGSLNAYNAVQTVRQKRFFEDELVQGQTKKFSIEVPAHTAQLKIMLVWTDIPATANIGKALINDLDAQLSLPATGAQWLPWVLNPTADIAALQLPPVRKKDTLNTAEQITVDNPTAGQYVFTVNSQHIQTATQKFAVVYQFDSAQHLQWTYPTASDVLTAGNTHIVRWQSNITATGLLEYSFNNGLWRAAENNVAVENQYIKWQVPDTTCSVRLRLRIPSLNFTITSEEFIIAEPTQINVGFNCTDSFMLYWNKSYVNKYQVYQLGEKYLEPIYVTADTFSILQKKEQSTLLYAVAPKIGNGTGARSYIIDYTTQGIGCYFQSFFATLQSSNTIFLQVQLGSLYGIKGISFQKQKGNGFSTIHTLTSPLSTIADYTDANLTTGINTYRVAITLANGTVIYSAAEAVQYFANDPVIVYPNPVRQGQPAKFIAQQPGLFSYVVYDVSGKLFQKGFMEDITQQLQTYGLAKGLYIIRFSSKEGGNFTKKLVVY